jgi:tripartite-type tricarboxylate transporter receptor subunit TctC
MMLVCLGFLLIRPVANAQSATSGDATDSIARFYRGKQIVFVVGTPTGGGYDFLARLMARHFGKHIPGQPQVVVKNVPGANGLLETNDLFNRLPQDGTHIGLLIRNMLLAPITNPGGVRFSLDKFKWIGSLATETAVAVAWHTAPVKTFDDLLRKELIVGGMTGVDPETTPRVFNALIGTKFKIVNGYKGTTDIALAMERGEVEGIGDWSWSSLNSTRPDWVRDHKVNVLLQGALSKDPTLPNTPFALDHVKNDFDRQVMTLYLAQKEAARPIVAPPGVPADRLEALREAFMAMARDPEFLADAEKSQLQVNPSPGATVQRITAMIASAPDDVVKRLVDILSGPAQ